MRLLLTLISILSSFALGAEAVDPAKDLDALLPKFSSADLDERAEAQRAYTRAIARAGRPGAEAERNAAVQAILAKLDPAMPQPALLFLMNRLQDIGKAECVAALGKLLASEDPLIRERARCALQGNPAAEAIEPVRAALAKATEPAWQAGLIDALGARRDAKSLKPLLALANSKDEGVRVAAAHALARIGDAAAAQAISAASQAENTPIAWNSILDGYLLLADALAAQGNRARALAMYKAILDAPGHLRLGALIGLGRAGGVDELPVLFQALSDGDAETRGAALYALGLLPPEVATKAITQKAAATPEVKVGLIRVLLERRDPAVLPTLVAAASDPSESVRIAACEGMGSLGDPQAVPTLLAAMSRAEGRELTAATEAIGSIRGEAVDKALIGALKDPKLCLHAVRLLAARKTAAAVPALLAVARDEDPELRIEAVKGLGAFAGEPALAPLVKQLVATVDTRERNAIARALAAIIPRVADPAARTKPILSALRTAPPETRLVLVPLLGACGTPDALEALRKSLVDAHLEVGDAAFRTLAQWPTAEAAPDLLLLAKTSEQLARKVLAFRGYVRLAGLLGDRPAAETVAMYQKAMAAAPRTEEKRLVLAGMAELADTDALTALMGYLDDDALRSEAVAAIVSVAKAVSGTDKAAAKTALGKAIEATTDTKLQKQAQDAIAQIDKFGDYVIAWEVAGPYTADGKSGAAYHSLVFPPEKGEAAKWKPMPVGRNDKLPMLMDLGAVLGGDDRVAYLRTRVWSPKEQKVRMEFGSDDGAKVWVNGSLVLEAAEPRSHKLDEDKKPVSLKQGWNPVLVKVWQGSMDWAFSLRFRSPDGKPLDGLKVKPRE